MRDHPDLDLDPDAATEDFKAQMFSLTGVEPERQKVGWIQSTAPALVGGLRGGGDAQSRA